MSHAECSCHAALLMSQNSESWTRSGNFTLSKALALQGKPMTHVVKDKGQIQNGQKRKIMSFGIVVNLPQNQVYPQTKVHWPVLCVRRRLQALQHARRLWLFQSGLHHIRKVIWLICCLARQDLIQGAHSEMYASEQIRVA